MKKEETYLIILIILVLFLVSAQQGCEMSGGGKTQAKKYGLDYSLIDGTDYMTSGKILQQGETFYVGVHIENYDQQLRAGEVCISDNVADTYGGISSQSNGECKPFNVDAADIIKKETSSLYGKKITEEIIPGKVDVYFPENNMYSYYGLPASQQPWSQKMFVSVRYRQTSHITGTVNVPSLSSESVALVQEPAPILLSVTKSIHRVQEAYKIDLELNIKKQQDVKIFSADFTQENITYFIVQLSQQNLQCTLANGEPITNKVSIENERLIKCSSFVYLSGEAQQSLPLVIALDYGVSIERQYPFGIKTV